MKVHRTLVEPPTGKRRDSISPDSPGTHYLVFGLRQLSRGQVLFSIAVFFRRLPTPFWIARAFERSLANWWQLGFWAASWGPASWGHPENDDSDDKSRFEASIIQRLGLTKCS